MRTIREMQGRENDLRASLREQEKRVIEKEEEISRGRGEAREIS